jgi:hypothetical protein
MDKIVRWSDQAKMSIIKVVKIWSQLIKDNEDLMNLDAAPKLTERQILN